MRYEQGSFGLAAAAGWLLAAGLVAAMAAASGAVRAEAGESGPAADAGRMLVEPEELHEQLGDPRLRILDARSASEHAEGHVPGAVHVDVGAWQAQGARPGGLHDADAWSAKVGGLGVTHDSRVVVYGTALPSAARVWWLLKYVGLDDVRLVNGGWQAWTAAELPVSTEAPPVAAASFEPRFQPDRLEEIEALKANLDDPQRTLVDTRSDVELAAGQIPGATHLEWTEVLGADGRFKSPEELRALFRERGIEPSTTAVCY